VEKRGAHEEIEGSWSGSDFRLVVQTRFRLWSLGFPFVVRTRLVFAVHLTFVVRTRLGSMVHIGFPSVVQIGVTQVRFPFAVRTRLVFVVRIGFPFRSPDRIPSVV
jgi:hypothetical protein